MRLIPLSLIVLFTLSGCGLLPGKAPLGGVPTTGLDPAQSAAVVSRPAATAALGSRSQRPEELDTTTAADKETALAAVASGEERKLGTAVVTLGPPAEQGIWLKSGLVTEVVQGRVETAAGQSLAVELRPGSGGALLSLAAFQALGLSLTELPELTVFAP